MWSSLISKSDLKVSAEVPRLVCVEGSLQTPDPSGDSFEKIY